MSEERKPSAGPEPTGGQPHYWSMEHHSYRDRAEVPAAEAVTAPTPVTPSGPGRSAGRLVVAAVLGMALAAGFGSFAAARSSEAADPGAGTPQVQAVQLDGPTDRGFGGDDRRGRGR